MIFEDFNNMVFTPKQLLVFIQRKICGIIIRPPMK